MHVCGALVGAAGGDVLEMENGLGHKMSSTYNYLGMLYLYNKGNLMPPNYNRNYAFLLFKSQFFADSFIP